MLQRPTLTSATTPDQAHIRILQPDVYTYHGYDDLKEQMLAISHSNVMKADFAAHYTPYSPFNVMSEFNDKFLDGRLTRRKEVVDLAQRLDLKKLADARVTQL